MRYLDISFPISGSSKATYGMAVTEARFLLYVLDNLEQYGRGLNHEVEELGELLGTSERGKPLGEKISRLVRIPGIIIRPGITESLLGQDRLREIRRITTQDMSVMLAYLKHEATEDAYDLYPELLSGEYVEEALKDFAEVSAAADEYARDRMQDVNRRLPVTEDYMEVVEKARGLVNEKAREGIPPSPRSASARMNLGALVLYTDARKHYQENTPEGLPNSLVLDVLM